MIKICGYSCKHNKSGVCQISVCDKTTIMSDKTEVQTLRYDELDYTIVPNSDIKPLLDKLQQENKILKENAENNDKVVDKVNWENQLLKKENRELKTQIEEYQKALDETMSEKIDIENNWNKLKEWLNNFHKLSEFEQWEIVKKIQEIEQGSDSKDDK